MGCCFGRGSTRNSGLLEDIDNNSVSLVRSLIVPDVTSPRYGSIRQNRTELLFDPLKSFVDWNQADTTTVGETTVATVQFVCRNGTPYTLKLRDHFEHTITHDDPSVTVNSVREPSLSLSGRTSVRISFTPRIVGTYWLVVKLNLQRIGGQEYARLFLAGPPAIGHTVVHNQANHLIMQCGIYYRITISPRDAYGNIARVNPDLLLMEVAKGGPSGTPSFPECFVDENYDDTRLELLVKLDEPGYYVGSLKYIESVIGLPDCEILCLTDHEFLKMERNIQTKFLNIEHKAKLLSQNLNEEPRKVKCYISPRLFQIREQNWLFITYRLFTCRVCNSTKIQFHEQPGKFTIDDGLQTPMTLVSDGREIMAAVFYSFIQRNSGGAETFQEKQRHFQNELRRLNPGMDPEYRPQVALNVRRFNLLESAMYATRGFKPDTWKKKFIISFEGESGIDIGGVSREFFTCICDTLFSGRNPQGLFTRLTDNPQGLIHPNSKTKRECSLGVEHYEFAGRIVGKCLFDTAMGNPLFVKAHFTRSFLAQLIGLRVSWKHFETDDPDVYRFRVEQIRDGSVQDLDLSLKFADEIFEDGQPGGEPLMVSLHPGGSKQNVTDSNKMDYLTQLAQYRLARSVSEEIRHFLKGLRDFVPDELLAMFDENELELLMCGIQELSFTDLKQHTEVRGYTTGFLQSVEWFWMVVSEFSPEEMSRLVQFVTGSSQIPPGGFSELRPPFLLASSGEGSNRLPYAHTCFNHLCLPEYDTFEQFRRSLMTAINEGSEGILLS